MFYVLIALCVVVVSTLTYGVVVKGREEVGGEKKVRRALLANLAAFVPVITFAMILMIPNIVHAATAGSTSSSNGLGYIAAALCTGLATCGTGYAVGVVGSSAVGAVSEDPKILGKTIIFVGLAEGIAIYGIIISIMILTSLG